jgi:hypothetical protein
MFVHGHPRALGWVKGHYRPPNSPTEEQLGLELELVPAVPGVPEVPRVPQVPEIPRPREETSPADAAPGISRPGRGRASRSAPARTGG